ncbi:amino acid ABC transporter permease [Enterovirga aerilata]|uniref:Amino acid ABC transporter permease n=1 Tax=Enterovirga aerilata TaxID=2730920 RepID=A0A849I9L9_9HYPH|nr:amino acid ABC transporter permease [Enterovirga sp. DB1703]NNM74524.1 amino acid ABC transporter permease [Enterovirga sp. DB1703]
MSRELSQGLVPIGGATAEIASDGRLTILPDARDGGLARRLRQPHALAKRLFGTPSDAAITLVCAALLAWAAVPLLRWTILDATFTGTTRNDCTGTGACWVFIRARFGQFMYGFYPAGERWRVDLAGVILLVASGLIAWPGLPRRRLAALLALVVLPPLGTWLLYGGLGLRIVETREWGGLMLTAFLSIYAAIIAVPLGILLALGRASRLPVIRLISTVFIEFWRGVPIIAVIFLASLLLPLILPNGAGIDRLARAVIGLGLCIAAYMAEAVRGGLQAIPPGQAEAASALGLGYWRTTGLIVLPQALRISLPALTNEFIALVKNTSLVLIVSIFDLLGIAQAALADPAWVGKTWEAYAFAGFIYWLACFGLSRWSRRIELKAARISH